MTAEDQIRRAITSFASAYRAGDLATLAAIYSDDLIKDRAGSPSEGKAATLGRISQVFAQFHTQIEVSVDELEVCGDLAYARGSFTVTLTARSNHENKTLRRRYVEIWRNEEGTWRVTRTMDNELP